MTDQAQERDEITAAIEHLPPASDVRGAPGHDQAIERARGAQLLQWRAAGLTYEQMAQQGGYADGSGARQALLRALDRHEAENAAQLRAIENHAYLADQRVLRGIISDPNASPAMRIRAIDARTRSAARHARLNGLDAPVQVAISAGVQAMLTDALAELEQELGDVIPGVVIHRGTEHPEMPTGEDPAR